MNDLLTGADVGGLHRAALLLLGPLAWGLIRQRRGLPAFDNNAAAWRVLPVQDS